MPTIKYWTGNKLTRLNTNKNDVFVFGSNPQGRHHAGAALAAKIHFDAQVNVGRGLQEPFQRSYALITKSLQKNYRDSSGVLYELEGERSVTPLMIKSNIKDLYECARQHNDKIFKIGYTYDTWPNGSPKKSLNGYTSQEMLEMFVVDQDIPPNIEFHESYKPHLEKLLKLEMTSPLEASELPSEIAFTKVALPYGWLGNMAPYPVKYNGITYLTTEALFQALRFIGNPEIQQEIIEQKSPMNAKMVAKKYKHILEKNGFELLGQKDIDNMKLCIKLKLEQHQELKKQLLDTQNVPLIEDCSSRPQGSGLFWGSQKTEKGWNGKNILGEVWMEYREQLKNNQTLTISESLTNTHKAEKETKKEYTFFFHLTSPFSNFHPAKFEYKNLIFISNEQFMMYSKAKTFKDEEIAQKILALNEIPLAKGFINGEITREQIVNDKTMSEQWNKLMMKVKYLGRDVKNYNEKVWVEKRTKVVLFGAREKFNQNEDLKQILLATGNTCMIEAAKFDKIWGIGLSEYDAKKISPDKWPGQNLLGQILDYLKTEFKNNLVKKVKP